MILVGVFINTFLPLVLSCFSLPVKGHLSESTLMQFRNERGPGHLVPTWLESYSFLGTLLFFERNAFS